MTKDKKKIVVKLSADNMTGILLFLVLGVPVLGLTINGLGNEAILRWLVLAICIFNFYLFLNVWNSVEIDHENIYFKKFMRKKQVVSLDKIDSINSIVGSYSYFKLKDGKTIYFVKRFKDSLLNLLRINDSTNTDLKKVLDKLEKET